METRTQLNTIREQRGVSAAQLAKLAGVSRQTIYAIEAGDYVPNTTLALQLAQILEVHVEDLFSLEPANPAPPKPVTVDLLNAEAARKGQPVQICRVGTHSIGVVSAAQPLMLPVADGVIVETQKNRAGVQLFPDNIDESKRLLIAGCDPGISLLVQHLARFDDVDLVVAPSSSRQALEWLKEGKIHVAGSHLRDSSTGEFNLPMIERLFPRGSVKVVTFAIWEQGLVVEAGNPKNIRGVADLARKDVRIVNREKGAGSRDLLDQKLQEAGVPAAKVNGYAKIAAGHLPAALAVSQKEADACIATRSAARAFGLSFIPLGVERYDLIVRRQYLRLASVQALLDVLNRAAIRRKLELLAGYDTSRTGQVLVA
ncbi:MAG TPA: substrate-binding domain-containing protein [Bryobacteraceae bacterium]|nr:substrate-binding domain-containing protein [Bryobacteraceae bacterium]